MRGIAIDAFLIFMVVVSIALITYSLWAPPLIRLLRDVKTDIDKTNRDVVD